MLHIFYRSVVESAISFAAICWGSSIRTRDLKRINKLIRKAGSVLGVTLEPLELIVQKRMLHKLMKMMKDSSHPLHQTVIKQKSVFSERLLQVHCRSERYKRSFLPAAISLHNQNQRKWEPSKNFIFIYFIFIPFLMFWSFNCLLLNLFNKKKTKKKHYNVEFPFRGINKVFFISFIFISFSFTFTAICCKYFHNNFL